jgi:hypothetical protein
VKCYRIGADERPTGKSKLRTMVAIGLPIGWRRLLCISSSQTDYKMQNTQLRTTVSSWRAIAVMWSGWSYRASHCYFDNRLSSNLETAQSHVHICERAESVEVGCKRAGQTLFVQHPTIRSPTTHTHSCIQRIASIKSLQICEKTSSVAFEKGGAVIASSRWRKNA